MVFLAARREVFFEIHLGQVFKTIAAVATQGRYRGYEYIRTYQLAFSREEGEWFYYKENGENKVHKLQCGGLITPLNGTLDKLRI